MISAESIYEQLTDEEDARACADISDSACRETPHNFSVMLLAHLFTKLGDAIASPKTVLAWVMASVQAPVGLVGLMVPIRESGSLIPQLAIASLVRRRAVRKWFWVAGAVAQGLAVASMGLVALSLERGASFLGALLCVAGGLWLAAAVVYSNVREYRGEVSGGRNALAEALKRLDLLRTDLPFRRFVLARTLLLCSALTAPFYVVLARERVGDVSSLLALFVIAAGLASLLAAPVWGRFADRSSRLVMTATGACTAIVGIVVYAVAEFLPGVAGSMLFLPAAYFVLSIAHDGVRVGRKTYVVDLGRGNRRTDYVSVSNSVIGVALLVAGLVSVLASVVGVSAMILLLSLAGFAGASLARSLPETT